MQWLTFAVVGGGPTGCEVAGQIAELARRTLNEDFRSIDATSAAVLLFDAGTSRSSARSVMGCPGRPRARSSASASRSAPTPL